MKEYSIKIEYVWEKEGTGYWFAYIPEFGEVSCSATGSSPKEVLKELDFIKEEVIAYYKENNFKLPIACVRFKKETEE